MSKEILLLILLMINNIIKIIKIIFINKIILDYQINKIN